MSNISSPQLLEHSHAVVLGAPGAGKTTLLRQLVSELEGRGQLPGEILVLTPNRLAANQLRDQIALSSGLATSSPRARSISSWAFEIARKQNPELKLISGAQQQAVVAQLVEQAVAQGEHLLWGIDRTTSSLTGFQQEIRDLLAVIIENQLDLQGLFSLEQEFQTKGLKVAKSLLLNYQQRIQELGAVDPSELLVIAIGALASSELPKVVLVDDTQDLTAAGLKLIQVLGEKTNSYLFGDPDAALVGYRATGESFLASFPSHTKFSLDSAALAGERAALLPRIAARIPTGLASDHRPKPASEQQASAKLFDNVSDESDWLAASLRRAKLVDGLPWDQMAVVARTRVQLDQIARELTARRVPVRILGVQQPLRNQSAARAVLDFGALSFALGEVDREQLLASELLGLDSLAVRRLFRELSQNPEFPRSRALVAKELFEELIESDSFEVKALNKATELKLKLSQAADLSAYQFVSEVVSMMPLSRLKTLAKGSGNVALAANRQLDSILELIAASQRFDLRIATGAREFVSSQLELGIPEDSLAPIGLAPAVTLATSSQLSGKSFALVAIPRLQEGIWPNLRPRTALLGAAALQSYLVGRQSTPLQGVRGELHDELRLFYKAVGSATGKLLLSTISTSEESPSQFFAMFGIELERSEINLDFDIRRQVGRLRKRALGGDKMALSLLATLALSGVPGAHPKNWQGLLEPSTDQPLFGIEEQKRLSASKLEAFEKCPLHWFIESFSGETGNFQASLGTLLHAAMEAHAAGTEVSEYVQSNWHTLEFESHWYSLAQARRSARMVAMLNDYLAKASPLVAAEESFEHRAGQVVISGKIDRIESGEAGAIVVDLKTGKPPSKDEVGKNRQLALYQIALESKGETVSHAQIVSVGGDSLRVLEQKLSDELRAEIGALIERADKELSQDHFLASISSHCSEDSNCQLLIARCVQDA